MSYPENINTPSKFYHLDNQLSRKSIIITIIICTIIFGIEFKLLTLMDNVMDKNYTSSSTELYYQLNFTKDKNKNKNFFDFLFEQKKIIPMVK